MSNPVLEQIPVRLKCVAISTPPVAPVDQNTGLPPAFWRGSGLAIGIGIFDNTNLGIDLSNLSYLQVILQDPDNGYSQLSSVQIAQADLVDTISIGDWNDGANQNALAVFTAAQLDVGLGAESEKDFWLVVQGFTSAGNPIIYAAGTITGYNPGIPIQPAASVVSLHSQNAPNNTDMTVTPTSQLHKELITVAGAARTFNCILSTVGAVSGAELTLVVTLPSTAGITMNIRSGLISSPVISTVTTGSVLLALLKFCYDANAGAWFPIFYLLPPI